MCEYISHLNKFKKYRYTCKRNTKEILHSKENSYAILLKCLGLDNLDSHTVYAFYRTENSIHNTMILSNKNEKTLNEFKSTVIQGSEGYLEFYVFPKNDNNDKKQFEKLYQLINEYCDVDKINSDFDSKFIHNLPKLVENFLLFSYALLTKYTLVIIGLIFTSFIISIYTELINFGYPYELIEHSSIIFLAKLLISLLFGYPIIILGIGISAAAFLHKLSKTDSEGEKIYKLIFTSLFYIIFFTILYSIQPLYNDKTFFKTYNDIHIFPRLMQKNNHIFYVLGRQRRVIYAYKLNDLLDKKQIENICNELDKGKDFYSLGTIIMSTSANIKNIHIMPINNATEYLDVNDSTHLIQKEYCQ